MATFEQALSHVKKGFFIQPENTKNESKIGVYKNRLYWYVQGVRVPYNPTNKHLFSEDWKLLETPTEAGV